MVQNSGVTPSWELLVRQTLREVSIGLTRQAIDLQAQTRHHDPMTVIPHHMMEMATDLQMACVLMDKKDNSHRCRDHKQVEIHNFLADILHHTSASPVPSSTLHLRQPGLQDMMPMPSVLPQSQRPLISPQPHLYRHTPPSMWTPRPPRSWRIHFHRSQFLSVHPPPPVSPSPSPYYRK